MKALSRIKIISCWRGIFILAAGVFISSVHAQQLSVAHRAARSLITQPIDDANSIELFGNTRPEANAKNDRGRMAEQVALNHMQLVLKRAPEREQALRRYVDDLHDPKSPSYHRWLTAAQFGEQYGAAQQDIDTITAWLTRHGFTVNAVYPSKMALDFSGTAGQVRVAFHTEIHNLNVKGKKHFANMSDPRLPAALADAVLGVASLHDFQPHPMHKPRTQYTTASGYKIVAPADLAKIYNLTPLFNNNISGQGQTIVVIEDTNVYSASDWDTFRATFGLSSYSGGSFVQVHPAPPVGRNNCSDPGVTADDGEAILDAEWASAAAPSATIELASCKNTTTFGGLIALQNLLNNSTSPPAIVSISYGQCEAINGAAGNAAFAAAYQQAVAQGVSVFVSSGDEGAAGCDANTSAAQHGIAVNGLASTPDNVAVGGTDFGDVYTGTVSNYWSSSNNANYGSALSYVPEVPWNNSCANALLAKYLGYSVTYGSSGFCNSTAGQNHLTTGGGSGGPSACASGTASINGVISGTCAGTPKPAWQTGVVGIPNDGVRDLPDVSLFAANGLWSHYYVFCWSDTARGGAACTGAPSGWSGAGGTSFAAPILAAIQALVNQKTGLRQGNPNYVYYAMAAGEYGSNGNGACNSSNGSAVDSNCVFYDVTLGDIDVNCTGTYNCYLPSGTNGVLSASSDAFNSAYKTTAGWDMATGIGTLNAANLVNYWNAADLSLSATAIQAAGGLSYFHVTLSNSGPLNASTIAVSTILPSGVSLDAASSSSNCTQSGQTVTCTASALANGASMIFTVAVSASVMQPIDLSFAASSNNNDANSSNNTLAIAATPPTFAELLQVQQFLLNKNTLTAPEIQRLDIFPTSQGDGMITFSDWLLLQRLVLGKQ